MIGSSHLEALGNAQVLAGSAVALKREHKLPQTSGGVRKQETCFWNSFAAELYHFGKFSI